MAVESIPLFGQFASFRYDIVVGTISFVFDFTFMDRTGSWYLSVFQPNGTPLRTGIRVVEGWPLTLRDLDSRLFEGLLLALRADGNLGPPGRDDFQGAVNLLLSTGEDAVIPGEDASFVVLVEAVP